jgi:hypothetical protein
MDPVSGYINPDGSSEGNWLTPVPLHCPTCDATYWEKREQHIVNETIAVDTAHSTSAKTVDEDYVESETLRLWYCWPNEHDAPDEISDKLDDLR